MPIGQGKQDARAGARAQEAALPPKFQNQTAFMAVRQVREEFRKGNPTANFYRANFSSTHIVAESPNGRMKSLNVANTPILGAMGVDAMAQVCLSVTCPAGAKVFSSRSHRDASALH